MAREPARGSAGLVHRPAPKTVGRYRIVGLLGRGGMGVVYEAFDSQLNRALAIKLVRTDRRGPRRRERILREAEAMARLSHPNVVQVFDVGTFEDQAFVAMELVQGVTLEAWRNARSRSVSGIVEKFIAAGRGLAAAHAAGLVHRDFKPSNVLVSRTGLIKVTDFGLAQLGDADASHAVVGTPAYMAPEQRGGHSDARSDQYSFCLAMFEALFGHRPGQSEGAVREADGAVAPYVAAALSRGLRNDSAERFESMDALLRRLKPPRRGRTRLVALAAVAGAVMVAGVMAQRNGPECVGLDAVGRSWNPNRAERVRIAFADNDHPYARHAAERVVSVLDVYAEHWTRSYRSTCVAETPAARAKARCLGQRARELAALVEIFESATATVVRHGVGAVHGLPAVAGCDDPNVPTVDADRELLDGLATIRASDLTGRPDLGLPLSVAVVQSARGSGQALLVAEALFRRARLLERAGEYERAREGFEEAYHAASSAGNDVLAAESAAMLVTVLGIRQSQFDAAMTWARHGQSLLDRTDSTITRAGLLDARGGARAMAGHLEDALQDFQSALALHTGQLGETDFAVAATLNNLATVRARSGDFVAAERDFSRALQTLERLLGNAHPAVGSVMANIAAVQTDSGRHEDALQTLSRANERLTAALGPEHPTVASNEINIGLIHLRVGESDQAERHLTRALAIRRHSLRANHPAIANAHTNRGDARLKAGRFDDADADYRAALAILGAELGRDDPRLVDPVRGLAESALARGDRDAALALIDDALASVGARDASRRQRLEALREKVLAPEIADVPDAPGDPANADGP